MCLHIWAGLLITKQRVRGKVFGLKLYHISRNVKRGFWGGICIGENWCFVQLMFAKPLITSNRYLSKAGNRVVLIRDYARLCDSCVFLAAAGESVCFAGKPSALKPILTIKIGVTRLCQTLASSFFFKKKKEPQLGHRAQTLRQCLQTCSAALW